MNHDKFLIIIGIMGIVLFILLVLVIIMFVNIRKTRKSNSQRSKVPMDIQKPEEEILQDDSLEMTIQPQFEDDIEHYMIKTAPESTVKIGKIHSVGRRENQQDTFAYSEVQNKEMIDEKGILLIVADGMGGLSNGAEVSSLTAVSMLRYFDEKMKDGDPSDELYNMVQYANDEVNKFLGEDGIGKCGSTLVAALVKNHKVYWISVGDSSIFLYHGNKLERLNTLHNYGEELREMAERGEISAQEAANHPKRAALTSYIGAGEIKLISQNKEPFTIEPGDRLILASDGIYGTATMEELEDMMHYDVEEAALKLRYLIESKNKRNQDNFTAIIVEDNY